MTSEQGCHVLLITPNDWCGTLLLALSLSVMPTKGPCVLDAVGGSTDSARLNCRGTTGGTVALESVLHCRGFCVNSKSALVVLGGGA